MFLKVFSNIFFTNSSTRVWAVSWINFLSGLSKKYIAFLVASIIEHKFFIPFTKSEPWFISSKFIFLVIVLVDTFISKNDSIDIFAYYIILFWQPFGLT